RRLSTAGRWRRVFLKFAWSESKGHGGADAQVVVAAEDSGRRIAMPVGHADRDAPFATDPIADVRRVVPRGVDSGGVRLRSVRDGGRAAPEQILVIVGVAIGGDERIETTAERATHRRTHGVVDEERLQLVVRIRQVTVVADAEGR